jgi:hypothetical protein
MPSSQAQSREMAPSLLRGSLQVIFEKGSNQKSHWQVEPWSPRMVQRRPSLAPASRPDRIRLSRRRLLALTGMPLLHLDIRTPFGDEVDEEQIESALQTALGPHRDKHELRGWHVLRVEDTHVGSLHRVLASFSIPNEASPHSELSRHEADYALPIELGLYGLGALLGPHLGQAQGQGAKPWQLLMHHEAVWYSALFVGSYGVHVKSIPASHPQALPRLLGHAAMVESTDSNPAVTPSILRLIGPMIGPRIGTMSGTPSDPQGDAIRQDDLTKSGEALEPWLVKLGLHRQAPDSPLTSEECLALGLATVASREEVRSHDQNPEEVAQVLREKRLFSTLVLSAVVSLASLAIGGLALAGVKHHHQGVKNDLAALASGHREQVVQLESLRRRLAAADDSLALLGTLAQEPYPTSLLLSRLGDAASQGGVQGMQLKRLDGGGVEMRMRAFTSNWEKVEGFRSVIASIPGATHSEIAEQRKESGQGKVIFDLAAKVAAP